MTEFELTRRRSGGWTKSIGGRRFYWPPTLNREEAARQAAMLYLAWQRMKRYGDAWTDERIDAILSAGGELPSNRARANGRRNAGLRRHQQELDRRRNERLHTALDEFVAHTRQRDVSQAYKARAGSAIALIKRSAPDVRLADFDLQRLGGLVDRVQAAGVHATIRTNLHFLRAALTYLDTRGRYELTFRSLRLLKPYRQRAATTIKVFTTDEVAILYRRASPLVCACMMLALNCGFTAADLATLTHESFFRGESMNGGDNHPDGVRPNCAAAVTIIKARNKTAVEGSWRLWPETVEALRKIGWTVAKRGLTLTTARGSPLVHYCAASGERADALGRAWHRLTRSLPEGRRLGFKHLRKTGATWIESVSSETVAQAYLAHISGSIARRHYLAPNDHITAQLCEALAAVRQKCVLPISTGR